MAYRTTGSGTADGVAQGTNTGSVVHKGTKARVSSGPGTSPNGDFNGASGGHGPTSVGGKPGPKPAMDGQQTDVLGRSNPPR